MKRPYYVAPVEQIHVKNFTATDHTAKVVQARITLQKDVLFYRNIFGVLIRFSDSCPLATYIEAKDYMAPYIYGKHDGIYTSSEFVDEDNLKPIHVSKEQEKVLKKERRMQRKEQRKRR